MEIISCSIKKVSVIQWLFILVFLFCFARTVSAQNGPPAYPPGGENRSILSFNGKDQSLDVTIPGFSGKSGTFEAWVRVDWHFAYEMPVFSNNIAKNLDNAFNIYIFPYGHSFQYGGYGQNHNMVVDADAEDWSGKFWRHLAVTWQYDENTALTKIYSYIDGREISDGEGNITITPGETFSIGSHMQEEYFGAGNLAEVRVWNVARTEAQISGSFKEILTGAEPGLLGYWRLDEASGASAANKVAGGNPAALNDKFKPGSWQPAVPSYSNAGKVFGVVSTGGPFENGAIFAARPGIRDVTFTEQFSYSPDGKEYVVGALLEVDGLLYGLNTSGGKFNKGTVFSFDPTTHEYKVVHQFDKKAGTPYSGLTRGPEGKKLYGTTREGGDFGAGTVFEYDIDRQEFKVRAHFDYTKGAAATGTMLLSTNNKFYGVAHLGGTAETGTLFEFDPATGELTKKVDLVGDDGYYAADGKFYEHSNGKIYGTTARGGAEDGGVLFEFDPATGAYTKKVDFTNSGTGVGPAGGLFEAPDGKLYTLSTSYPGHLGGLLEYNVDDNTLTPKFTFDDDQVSFPISRLVFLPDGRTFGIGLEGGDDSRGNIFEYDPNSNTATFKQGFDDAVHGSYSQSPLTLASNGKLYCVTRQGGPTGFGAILQYDADADALETVKTFTVLSGAETITNPRTTLIQVSDTKLYGASNNGGALGDGGTLFEYDIKTGEGKVKASFNPDGAASGRMGGDLVFINGKIYGATQSGGTNDWGALFEYDIATEEYSIKRNFLTADGRTQAFANIDAKLYGVTFQGGASGVGVLFEYDIPSASYSIKHEFDNTHANPTDLIYGNGKLYGVTKDGGANSKGVLFHYDVVNNVYEKLIDLPGNVNSQDGSIAYYNGKLYLTVTSALFEYDLHTGEIKVLHSFNSPFNGTEPKGEILITPDGKIYGMTRSGGRNNSGCIYEYDIENENFERKWDFASPEGRYPYSGLTLVRENQELTFNAIADKVYGADAFTPEAQATSAYPVTYESSNDAVAEIQSGKVVITGTGTVTITAKQDGTYYYKPVEKSHLFNVTKAPLNVTAENKSRPYKTTNPELTIKYEGFVYDEDAGDITTPVVSATASEDSDAGAYPISLTGGDAVNYELIRVNGTLTITKVDQTITFTSVPVKTTGDAPFSLEASASTGLPVSFSASKSLVTISGNTATVTDPGSETITASQPGNTNYNAATAERTFCINPAKPAIAEDFTNADAPVLTSSANTGNQWFKDGASVGGANSKTFIVSGAGQFTVQATVDGCVSILSDASAIIVTGVYPESSPLKVFPNPAISRIIVEFPEAGEKQIDIFGADGKVMDSSVTDDLSAAFDVNRYNTGLYVIKVHTAKGHHTIKFIKK